MQPQRGLPNVSIVQGEQQAEDSSSQGAPEASPSLERPPKRRANYSPSRSRSKAPETEDERDKEQPEAPKEEEESSAPYADPDTPIALTGPSLAAQNTALKDQVGSLQNTINAMSGQVADLIFKLNQIDFTTVNTIAAAKKASDEELAQANFEATHRYPEEAPAATLSTR